MNRFGVRSAVVVGLVVALVVGWSHSTSRVATKLTSGALISAVVPSAPRMPSAVPGNATATVRFLAPSSNGGSAIIAYIVTPYVGGVGQTARVFNSNATTQIIGGLSNATAYTFKIAAKNSVGTGPQSVATASIVVGAPTAPRSATAAPGNSSATVSFDAPVSNNGSAITAYVVTPYLGSTSQGARTFDPSATTATVTGLTNAKTYSFKVAAKNVNGTSTQSSAGSVVIGTPVAPTSVTARVSNGVATTQWTAPSTDGGSPITGYSITQYLNGTLKGTTSYTSTATSESISGLTSTGAYTFRIAARNARGLGPKSELSCLPMTSGQADINANPAGTRFCLSGTHNWTLTPKSRNAFIGPAVLDGNGTVKHAFVANGSIVNVLLDSLEIRNYVNGDQAGAISVNKISASGWTLQNLQVHDNSSSGSNLGSSWTVTGGRFWNNRQEGLGGLVGNGVVVDGVEIDHNNFTDNTYTTRNVSCGYEAGGFKWVSNNVTVTNSVIHDNACKGLWSDLAATKLTVTNNVVYNNWDEGIFVEISGTATVTGNVVMGNGFHNLNGRTGAPCGTWGWGGGITISTSGRTHSEIGAVDVGFNTVVGNCNGITGVDQHRTERGCGMSPKCELANVAVHDNVISGSATSGAANKTGAFEDDGDNLATHNITFTKNTFSGGATFCGVTC